MTVRCPCLLVYSPVDVNRTEQNRIHHYMQFTRLGYLFACGAVRTPPTYTRMEPRSPGGFRLHRTLREHGGCDFGKGGDVGPAHQIVRLVVLCCHLLSHEDTHTHIR